MLSAEVRDELAAELAEAERSRVPTTPLTDRFPDIDVVDAYEIQLINIRRRPRSARRSPRNAAQREQECRHERHG
ncbi:2-keto-4-pentenoate hydratase [Mycolicibacterium neoaurum]|uniref:2-keto-4-pentenoate hydratase n=1 Tax=Mycolicibacterium neoaurum TaxID=1795 RepID=A0AAV2WJY0_MYCNE|nr:2-keto-4-pentenoate hydratase [Mycolicibacterium neoaurum]